MSDGVSPLQHFALTEAPCPKCGEFGFFLKYRVSDATRPWALGEHIQATCRTCGYVLRVRCRDDQVQLGG